MVRQPSRIVDHSIKSSRLTSLFLSRSGAGIRTMFPAENSTSASLPRSVLQMTFRRWSVEASASATLVRSVAVVLVAGWKCSVTNTMSLIEKLSTLSLSTYAPSLSLWTVLAGFDDAKKSSCRVCTLDQMRDLVRLWHRHE
jgi:hypothetical protein